MVNNKTNFKLLAFFLFVFVGLIFATYFLFAEISSAKNFYIEKTKELLGAEKKQEQIDQITKELKSISNNKEDVIASIISPDRALDFIVKIEDIARAAGLIYEVRISKEITQESIDEELLAIRRSQRRGRDVDEADTRNKLPGIILGIELSGTYSGIVRFLEGIASFPYYSYIENFSITKASESGVEDNQILAPRVQAAMQLMVFTKK